jgi:hypothetical protein
MERVRLIEWVKLIECEGFTERAHWGRGLVEGENNC